MNTKPHTTTRPTATLLLTGALLAVLAIPRVHGNAGVVTAVLSVAAILAVWQGVLWGRARRTGQALLVEFVPIKSHWVQACVQFSILLWWGWYWRDVYNEMPLILAQVLFLYSFEALVTWSRGRTWRLGFGPLPIIFSTNLLLWFRDDWFILQFVMVAAGAMGKQFFTWKLADRTGHIFNPSAFGQSLIAVALISTAMTKELTLGPEIAAEFETPYMLIVIFLGGLIVQYLFHVTLMTLAAAAVLCLVNLCYTWATGTYFFVNVSIAAPIFLGIHLLITDPSTSPRTNLGRVIFGGAYALGYCILFRVLDMAGIPAFWDKLLPVPILNLCVPLIDRLCRSGLPGRINAAWEGALRPARMNLVHMGCWSALFATMMFTGFAYGPHPGDSIPFWKQAVKDGKPYAERSLAIAIASQAMAAESSTAHNELGLLSLAGRGGAAQSRSAAAKHFCTACDMGDINGCENVVMQYLFLGEARSEEDLANAFRSLEAQCPSDTRWKPCYLLATAYETGRGLPKDLARALELYERCGPGNIYACKGRARIALAPGSPPADLHTAAPVLSWYSQQGDAESSWYMAYMYFTGHGLPIDPAKGRTYLDRACEQGYQKACAARTEPALPAFVRPPMVVPNWSTAYPEPSATSRENTPPSPPVAPGGTTPATPGA